MRAALDRTIAALREKGASFVELSLPHTSLALPAYYLVAPAEASSNLARYDGVRFGKRAEASDLLDLYRKTRGAGFGPEVKRRIMLGTYALRSGYYDAYYKKAQQIRTLIKRDFDAALRPRATCCSRRRRRPPRSGSARSRRRSTCTSATCSRWRATSPGCRGCRVPCGLSRDGLPIGAQLLGRPLDEVTLLRAGAVIEAAVGLGERRPTGIGGLS